MFHIFHVFTFLVFVVFHFPFAVFCPLALVGFLHFECAFPSSHALNYPRSRRPGASSARLRPLCVCGNFCRAKVWDAAAQVVAAARSSYTLSKSSGDLKVRERADSVRIDLTLIDLIYLRY